MGRRNNVEGGIGLRDRKTGRREGRPSGALRLRDLFRLGGADIAADFVRELTAMGDAPAERLDEALIALAAFRLGRRKGRIW